MAAETQHEWKDRIVDLAPREFVLTVTEGHEMPDENSPDGEIHPVVDLSGSLEGVRSAQPSVSIQRACCRILNDLEREMPELANPLAKTRVQLDLSPREVDRMNWMMEMCEIESRKDLFNNALTLLEWAILAVASRQKVASFYDPEKERNILSMPVLNTAAAKAGRYIKEAESKGEDGESIMQAIAAFR